MLYSKYYCYVGISLLILLLTINIIGNYYRWFIDRSIKYID